jgi:hypothetical protein
MPETWDQAVAVVFHLMDSIGTGGTLHTRLGMQGKNLRGPKALTSPIAMGIKAAQIKRTEMELRPATRIQRPKPTIKAEIA